MATLEMQARRQSMESARITRYLKRHPGSYLLVRMDGHDREYGIERCRRTETGSGAMAIMRRWLDSDEIFEGETSIRIIFPNGDDIDLDCGHDQVWRLPSICE